MDTEAQHTERDPSSGMEDGSRSARVSEDTRSTPSWRRTALVGGACVAFLLLLSHFVLQPFLIPSGSMEPTLQVGDRILVNKLAYRFGSEPGRGDVVVFDGTGSFVREQPRGNPVTGLLHDGAAALGLAEPDETDFVKRVVGIGGDRVICCDRNGRLHRQRRPRRGAVRDARRPAVQRALRHRRPAGPALGHGGPPQPVQ